MKIKMLNLKNHGGAFGSMKNIYFNDIKNF